MRYYYPEHQLGYQRIKAEGKTAWAEIHGVQGFDNFASRTFLEMALPRLTFDSTSPEALEIGCGTGPGACFLAERGFRVRGLDLIPDAIAIARDIANRRGLNIEFQVADVCELPADARSYDLVVDSFCLQCVVFDHDRQAVFSAVRSRLGPGGYYLISTAILDEEHETLIGANTIRDAETGTIYTEYGSGIIDLKTGIVLRPYDSRPEHADTIRINGLPFLPHRRHLRPAALFAELHAAGFQILFSDDHHAGSIACALGT